MALQAYMPALQGSLGIRRPRNKYRNVAESYLSYCKKRKRRASRTRMLKRRMIKLLEKLLSQRDGIHSEYGALLRYTQDYHKRLSIIRKVLVQEKEMFEGRKAISIDGTIIYYMGPSPAREGRPIGSAGPTTASRMDKYAPQLLDLGLLGMIGKGRRSSAVKEAVVRNGAVYFAAVGGAGALLSKSIREAEIVAYEDLGTEAIRKLTVEEFPVIVCMDSEGTDLYETAAEKYREEFV